MTEFTVRWSAYCQRARIISRRPSGDSIGCNKTRKHWTSIQLERWAQKKGKTIAIVPVLEQLQEKQEVLLFKKIIESSEKLERFVEPGSPEPLTETTEVGAAPVRAHSAAAD